MISTSGVSPHSGSPWENKQKDGMIGDFPDRFMPSTTQTICKDQTYTYTASHIRPWKSRILLNSTCWLNRVTWLCQLNLYRTRFDFSGFIMNCILSLVILLSRHQLTSYLSRSHCPFLSSIKRKYRLKYYFLQASCNILNFHWYDPFLWKFQTIARNSFFLFKFTKLPLSATRNLSTITSLITSHRENHCIHFVLEQT